MLTTLNEPVGIIRQQPDVCIRMGRAEEAVGRVVGEAVYQAKFSAWGAPVLLVKKKDGSMRLCVDYR